MWEGKGSGGERERERNKNVIIKKKNAEEEAGLEDRAKSCMEIMKTYWNLNFARGISKTLVRKYTDWAAGWGDVIFVTRTWIKSFRL